MTDLMKPNRRSDHVRYEILDPEAPEPEEFPSLWAAEEFLDELALTDPARHARCTLQVTDPFGNDDVTWSAEQLAEALR